jgi:hypothetical protein
MMYAELINSETGKSVGKIREETLPRKGEVIWITKGKMISKYSVQNIEWNYSVNTLYPKDPLSVKEYNRIILSHIVTVQKEKAKTT